MEVKFDAGYNRVGIITVEKSSILYCNRCKEIKICLYVDNSEEEYAAAVICKDCIDFLFANFEK